MRRFRAPTLAAVIATIVLSLVGATSATAYLAALGPKECCRSTCHRGKAPSQSDAERCCSTHLGVLPAALGPTAPDLHHVLPAFTARVTATPTVLSSREGHAPAAVVMLRGSPPSTLVAVHTALLV